MTLYRCSVCGEDSEKINGFISRRDDSSLPQREDRGCNCFNSIFYLIEEDRDLTDSGDTKTKLVLEAGEVIELKLISKLLMYFADTSGMFKDISEIRKKYREYVSSSNWLNEFIQKHEGRDKS